MNVQALAVAAALLTTSVPLNVGAAGSAKAVLTLKVAEPQVPETSDAMEAVDTAPATGVTTASTADATAGPVSVN